MKKVPKLVIITTLLLCIFTFLPTKVDGAASFEHPKITTRKAIMEWRYKVEKGNVYRRLWDSQKGEWASGWIKIN
ncbi:hypothetical protein [Enterococcus cecorum]|uniref:hypothetical protein n=1 Tax=Enterococcus cecorum TaxID=44008 RepID=UPI003F2335DB